MSCHIPISITLPEKQYPILINGTKIDVDMSEVILDTQGPGARWVLQGRTGRVLHFRHGEDTWAIRWNNRIDIAIGSVYYIKVHTPTPWIMAEHDRLRAMIT